MDIQGKKFEKPIWFLQPEGGKHYIISFFRKEIGEVFYLKGETEETPPLIFLCPLLRQVAEWDMEWKEIVTKRKAMERGYDWALELPFLEEDPSKNDELTDQQKKERELSREVIAVRKEPIWFLLHKENHPIIVPFSTNDGSDFLLIVSAVYEITDAVLAKTSVKNFLTFGELAITAELGTIGREKNFDQALQINHHQMAQHVVSKTQRGTTPTNGETVIDYLNKHKFEGKGFKLCELEFVRVMVAPRSRDIQEAKESKRKAVSLAEAYTITQDAINKNTIAAGKAKAQAINAQLETVYTYEKHAAKLEDQTAIRVSENYGKAKALTIFGQGEKNSFTGSSDEIKKMIIANTIQTNTEVALAEEEEQNPNQKKKGGKK